MLFNDSMQKMMKTKNHLIQIIYINEKPTNEYEHIIENEHDSVS